MTAGSAAAACFPAAAAPGAGDFASGRDLEWCQVHQTRHMAEQAGPLAVAGELDQAPGPHRLVLTAPDGREVLVMTYRNGHVCTSYDEQDLDEAARAILAEVIGIAVDPAGCAPKEA